MSAGSRAAAAMCAVCILIACTSAYAVPVSPYLQINTNYHSLALDTTNPSVEATDVFTGINSYYGYGFASYGTLRSYAVDNVSVRTLMADDITVVPGGNWTDPVTVVLTMSITGMVSGPRTGYYAELAVSGRDAQYLGDVTYGNVFDNLTSDQAISRLITLSFKIGPVDPTFNISALLMATASAPGSIADLSHTGQLAIILPEGFSYRSASGSFLVPPSEVPLPPGLLLMVAGLGFVRLVGRNRGGPQWGGGEKLAGVEAATLGSALRAGSLAVGA